MLACAAIGAVIVFRTGDLATWRRAVAFGVAAITCVRFAAVLGTILGNLLVGDPLQIAANTFARAGAGDPAAQKTLKVLESLSDLERFSGKAAEHDDDYAGRIGLAVAKQSWHFNGVSGAIAGGAVKGLTGAAAGLGLAIFAFPVAGMVWASIVYRFLRPVVKT